MHRQVGRLLALENPAGVDAGSTIRIGEARCRSSSGRRPRRYSRYGYRSAALHGAAASSTSCSRRRLKERDPRRRASAPTAPWHDGRERGVDFALRCWPAATSSCSPSAARRRLARLPAALRYPGLLGLTSTAMTVGARERLRAAAPAASPPISLSDDAHAGEIAPRPIDADHEAQLDWIGTGREHDWYACGRGLGGEARLAVPLVAITATLRATSSAASAGNRSGCPSAQRYSIGDVPALDEAGRTEPLTKRIVI